MLILVITRFLVENKFQLGGGGVNWDPDEAVASRPWPIANYAPVKHVISFETLCCMLIDSKLQLVLPVNYGISVVGQVANAAKSSGYQCHLVLDDT